MSNKSSLVIAITGPTGSGKTTIATKLTKQLDRCVNIDADHVKHMIVSGFYRDDQNPGGWGFSEWGLVGDSIGVLAANFLKEGYNVIVHGYIDTVGWANIEKHISFTHKIMLLPQINTIVQRDQDRKEEARMGYKSVAAHYDHFSNDSFFHDFLTLDTTNDTEDESIEKIKKLIGLGVDL